MDGKPKHVFAMILTLGTFSALNLSFSGTVFLEKTKEKEIS